MSASASPPDELLDVLEVPEVPLELVVPEVPDDELLEVVPPDEVLEEDADEDAPLDELDELEVSPPKMFEPSGASAGEELFPQPTPLAIAIQEVAEITASTRATEALRIDRIVGVRLSSQQGGRGANRVVAAARSLAHMSG